MSESRSHGKDTSAKKYRQKMVGRARMKGKGVWLGPPLFVDICGMLLSEFS